MPLGYTTNDPNASQDPSSMMNYAGTGSSLIGAGLGAYNTQQGYNTLANALKTIGPTNLQGWNLNGPGGMQTGFNPQTGQGNINLGALNPAFGGFAGAAGAGSSMYNPALLAGLTGTAGSTLSPALSTLFGAYSNYGAGMGAANTQLQNLGNFNNSYNTLLGGMRAQMQPQIQQQAYGLQNTLFGNGVADSTGAASGSLAAQNFGRGVGQADASAQLAAFQQALGQQNSAASNYSTLANGANGILANAFQNFGGTNQLISGLNTQQLTNAATAAQGAGAVNTVGLNNYNSALQTGVAQGTVRNQSLFPYASLASQLGQAGINGQNGMGVLASLFGNAGTSLSGNNSGLAGLIKQYMNGGSSGSSPFSSLYQSFANGSGPAGITGASDGLATSGTGASDFLSNTDWSSYFGGPSAAGGGAADAGQIASGAQSFDNAAVAGWGSSGTALGDGAGITGASDALATSGAGESALAPGYLGAGQDLSTGAASGGGMSSLGAYAPAMAGAAGMYMLNQYAMKQLADNPMETALTDRHNAAGSAGLAQRLSNPNSGYIGGHSPLAGMDLSQLVNNANMGQSWWNNLAQLELQNPNAVKNMFKVGVGSGPSSLTTRRNQA